MKAKKYFSEKNNGLSKNPHVPSGMVDLNFKPLGLTSNEIDDIVAFLESLTDEDFDKTIPASVPSGLEVGGKIH